MPVLLKKPRVAFFFQHQLKKCLTYGTVTVLVLNTAEQADVAQDLLLKIAT